MDLSGRVALITGAGRRVGRAIAEELAGAGCRLIAHCRESRLEAEDLCRRWPETIVLSADLRDGAARRSLIEEAVSQAGRIDILVNNAATYARRPLAEHDDAFWRETLALNLEAPASLIRLSLDHGLRSVVNLVDVAAWQPWRNHAAYAASKAGLTQLTRTLALELAPTVRVNAVAPGTVALPPDADEDEHRRALARIPVGRIGAPSDVARAVRFLLAEDYLTGVVLPVDGGAGLR